MQYRYIFVYYTTILSFITAEFGGMLASIFGLESFYLPTSVTIIFLWIIVLISALFGLIVIHIGKALLKLNIIPLKIKQIIELVSESSVLPLCIGSGILGLFMGLVAFLGNVLDLIFKGFGIIPLIYIGIVLTIVMGLKIITHVFYSNIKSSIKFLIAISVLGISVIILTQALHFVTLSLLQE